MRRAVLALALGLMLASFEFASYANTARALVAGDRLLLYTDGLIEAANGQGDWFGQDALAALLRETGGLAASAAADRIISSVQGWAASQDDDLTVVMCDYRPSG